MLGFRRARNTAAAAARWRTGRRALVHRDEMRSGAVLLPPRETISRRLIDYWLEAVA